MKITQLYASGQVQRWHMNPTLASTCQTLADHQGRCVQLLLFLNPAASPALIRAVAFHDVGEFVSGDLARPFKTAEPALAAGHAEFEGRARRAIVGDDPELTADEAGWLKLIDFLECAAYMLLTRPWEATRRGWPAAIAHLREWAEAMGVGAPVATLIGDLTAGEW